jgi:hypothetical protein
MILIWGCWIWFDLRIGFFQLTAEDAEGRVRES